MMFIFFQNCSQSLQSKLSSNTVESVAINDGISLKTEGPLYYQTDLTFQLSDSQVQNGSQFEWFISSPNSVCRGQKEISAPALFTVYCADSASVLIKVKVRSPSGSVLEFEKTANIATSPLPGNSQVATTVPNQTFNISMGTGVSSWNTTSSVVEAYVGQVLRIRNLDNVDHQMHIDRFNPVAAANDRPCRQGSGPIKPGQFFDCLVTKTYTMGTDPQIWDQVSGPNARFYLSVLDGHKIYENKCMRCHGAIATSTKRNSSVAQINEALRIAPTVGNPTTATAAEVRALEWALSH